MRKWIAAFALGVAVFASGCVVVPEHESHYHHCGYYHCR
jgi:hypothetical protein